MSITSRGTQWYLPRVLFEGGEVYYVITFYVPRFLSLDPSGRLALVLHELYHVSEQCDGDLRRFAGFRSPHGRSVRAFEAGFQADLAVYVASRRTRLFHDLLHRSHREIVAQYGSIRPRRIRRPVLSRQRATWHYEAQGETGVVLAMTAEEGRSRPGPRAGAGPENP